MPNRLRTVVLLLFALSGAAGLIHEIAWTRALRHVLGGSSLALTSVLIAFLGGLALGAWWVARRSGRLRRPLILFAWLECLIAAWTVLLPTLLETTWPLWQVLYARGPGVGFTVARLVVSWVLLAPAAIAMGASLPLLAALEGSDSPRRGSWIAGLYGSNALGATLGALGAGFVLLPALGLTSTIRLAAGLNLVAGLGAFFLARGRVPETRSPPQVAAAVRPQRWLLGLYLLAAAALFIDEVAWARVATLLLGSTTYAFSLLLAVIVAGLAMGGWVAVRFMKTAATARVTLAVSQGLVALSSLAIVAVVPGLPYAITRWYAEGAAADGAGLWVVAAVVVGLFLIPSLLMGLVYPLVCRVALGDDSPGRPAARVQAAGNLGAVLGVVVAALVAMPQLGLQNTLILAAGLNAAVALGVGYTALARRRGVVFGFVLVWVVAAIALPSWDPARLSAGPFIQARRQPLAVALSSDELKRLEGAQQVLFHRDGRESSLTVKQTPDGERSLWINGKPDASSVSDMATQRLLAHIPLLLHEAPKHALILGLGSGVTLRSAASYPLERIDTVEISAAARDVAAWFEEVNDAVLDDPRVRLIVADGRLHLALTDQRYDVIVSEPSNPWIAGIGDLYTQEFFAHVNRRLAPGGLFCLWLPAYHLDTPTFGAIVATFHDAFPETSLWHTQGSDYLLVGSPEFSAPLPEAWNKRMQAPDVRRELDALGIRTPSELLANLVLTPVGVGRFTTTAERNTDDNALLEYRAPRRLLANPDEAPLLLAIERARVTEIGLSRTVPEWLQDAQASRVARGAAIRASLLLSAGRAEEGIEALREAARANPADAFLERTLAANQRHADSLAAAGRVDEAIARYRLLLDVAPTRRATREGLARWVGSEQR